MGLPILAVVTLVKNRERTEPTRVDSCLSYRKVENRDPRSGPAPCIYLKTSYLRTYVRRYGSQDQNVFSSGPRLEPKSPSGTSCQPKIVKRRTPEKENVTESDVFLGDDHSKRPEGRTETRDNNPT